MDDERGLREAGAVSSLLAQITYLLFVECCYRKHYIRALGWITATLLLNLADRFMYRRLYRKSWALRP